MKINISRTFARFSLFLIKPFFFLSDCKETRTQNHLVHKQTLNHLAKLATIECGFTLKCIQDMTRTYSHSLSLCVFTTTMSELWNLWQWHANEWYLETLIGQLNVSFQWSNMKLFKDLPLGFNGSDSSFSSLSSLNVSDLEMANVSGLVFFQFDWPNKWLCTYLQLKSEWANINFRFGSLSVSVFLFYLISF